MGTIIEFPASAIRRSGHDSTAETSTPATVVILPVVRIERHVEPNDADPEAGTTRGRRRRRRARS
jgi:hypothetical protein